ncbi:aspartyl protease 25 [Cocos nucifera]|uniref:Aspartyl protease 25 n=1 Tax=Cocos nucifera TaxID=13894 RepID=A0A8K0MZ52_COCNU|nr:aspartyl protease 25 [Cocos nucifera]
MAFLFSPFLSLLLLLFSTAIAADIPIFHSKAPPPPASSSLFDSVLAAAHTDPARLAFLSQKATSVPIASGQQLLQSNSYVLRARLGSPGQLLLLVLDTGSDAAWVPCSPCSSCPSSNLFLASNSTTYSSLPCSSSWCPMFQGQPCAASPTGPTPSPCTYNSGYGGDSTFAATLSQDSLRLALDVIPNYAFGCVNAVTGSATSLPKQGLLGLGGGPMSLLSQAGSLYKGVFSYCLPSFRSYYFSGSLRLGPVGQPRSIRTTPLLHNPHRPSLYYVNQTGISVGRVRLAVPPGSFGFDPATGAGTVVDSGTVITRFVSPIYSALRDEFRRQVNASGGYSALGAFDTCFSTDEVSRTPPVTLHFEGLDLVLPVENTLIHSSARPLACLAMAEEPGNVNSVVNVIASLQQQNMRVMIDVANGRVGFAREVCN